MSSSTPFQSRPHTCSRIRPSSASRRARQLSAQTKDSSVDSPSDAVKVNSPRCDADNRKKEVYADKPSDLPNHVLQPAKCALRRWSSKTVTSKQSTVNEDTESTPKALSPSTPAAGASAVKKSPLPDLTRVATAAYTASILSCPPPLTINGRPGTRPFSLDPLPYTVEDIDLPRPYNAAYPHPLTAYTSPGVNPAAVAQSGYVEPFLRLLDDDFESAVGSILFSAGHYDLQNSVYIIFRGRERNGNAIPEGMWSQFENPSNARLPTIEAMGRMMGAQDEVAFGQGQTSGSGMGMIGASSMGPRFDRHPFTFVAESSRHHPTRAPAPTPEPLSLSSSSFSSFLPTQQTQYDLFDSLRLRESGEMRDIEVSKEKEMASLSEESHWKTEMCVSWDKVGSCKYGTQCQFAHGIEDLRITKHQLAMRGIGRPSELMLSSPASTKSKFSLFKSNHTSAEAHIQSQAESQSLSRAFDPQVRAEATGYMFDHRRMSAPHGSTLPITSPISTPNNPDFPGLRRGSDYFGLDPPSADGITSFGSHMFASGRDMRSQYGARSSVPSAIGTERAQTSVHASMQSYPRRSSDFSPVADEFPPESSCFFPSRTLSTVVEKPTFTCPFTKSTFSPSPRFQLQNLPHSHNAHPKHSAFDLCNTPTESGCSYLSASFGPDGSGSTCFSVSSQLSDSSKDAPSTPISPTDPVEYSVELGSSYSSGSLLSGATSGAGMGFGGYHSSEMNKVEKDARRKGNLVLEFSSGKSIWR